MLPEEQFWSILEQASDGATTSADPETLAELLTPLSTEDVTAFGNLFYQKLCDLNSHRLWGAGFVITGGMGDDSFHYFRSWIIGKGRKVFELALSNPDELGPYVDDPDVDNELLEYVATEICESRGLVKTQPDMPRPSRPATSSRRNPCRSSTPNCPPASPKRPAAAASCNAASPTPAPDPYNQSPPLPGR